MVDQNGVGEAHQLKIRSRDVAKGEKRCDPTRSQREGLGEPFPAREGQSHNLKPDPNLSMKNRGRTTEVKAVKWSEEGV